jgi:glycerol-3-phosphate dehydrogenase
MDVIVIGGGIGGVERYQKVMGYHVQQVGRQRG